jgi:HEAT repeat protein
VLDRLEQENDPERRGRLSGVMIAMGDEAAPTLVEALVQGSKRRMRVAVRLAGETQNPRLVECLREVLLSGESEVSREAARALVRVGDVTSLEVLAEALHSLRPEVTALAAFSLGSTGRVLAIAPLQEALARALDQNDLALAREVVRGLGRLGRAEAAPVLVGVLERGGLFGRRKLREVQLAAITALAHLPGAEAETALARAARGRDGRLREAATAALRRAPADGTRARRSAPEPE